MLVSKVSNRGRAKKVSPEVPANKSQIRQKASRSVLHIDTLLGVARNIRVIQHVELNVLQGRSLRYLPVDCAHIGRWIRRPNINLEVLDAAQEVVLVQIPLSVVAHVGVRGNNTQSNKA